MRGGARSVVDPTPTTLSDMKPTPLNLQDPPPGFKCPYRYQCFSRELLRWAAAALISALVAGLTSGCMRGSLEWQGFPPGLWFKAEWMNPLPTSDDQPTPTTAPADHE
jgi:hypothetical protein